MPITSISSIWYPVSDWERAKQFYSLGLGLTLDQCDDEAGYAAFTISDGDPALFLVRRPDLAGDGGGAVITFDVTNSAELLATVVAYGGEVDEEIQESEELRIFTIYDPDDNAAELAEMNPSVNS